MPNELVFIYGKDYLGFVYIWYDVKRKKFYIGSHMGPMNDNYVCSSRQMKRAYKRRPHTFRRKILSVALEERALRVDETQWLALIKDEELGARYYNLKKVSHGGRICTPEQMGNYSRSWWASLSDDERKKISQRWSKARKKNWTDPEYRAIKSKQSKMLWNDPSYREKVIAGAKKPRKLTTEYLEVRRAVGKKAIGRKWYNDGRIEKQFHSDPGSEWKRGRLSSPWNKR